MHDTDVDPQRPWLGLDSFSESTRGFFHGREDEIAELARRVQRKPLTVLFGQSGLGKTSILRAGLVPRLRPEGYCPVYLRVDHGPQAPPPAEQLKQAIDSGYVLLKFTETKGGTELGVCLDRSRMVLNGADFEVGTGTVQVCGTLLLNYNEVEFPAEIDIATLKGKGRLNLIADEPTCRARQAQREGREENRDTRG
jgi:hypothetical protein